MPWRMVLSPRPGFAEPSSSTAKRSKRWWNWIAGNKGSGKRPDRHASPMAGRTSNADHQGRDARFRGHHHGLGAACRRLLDSPGVHWPGGHHILKGAINDEPGSDLAAGCLIHGAAGTSPDQYGADGRVTISATGRASLAKMSALVTDRSPLERSCMVGKASSRPLRVTRRNVGTSLEPLAGKNQTSP
jgi:hypothetical protein